MIGNDYLLFLDDVRDPNKFLKDIRTWITARNYQEFVEIIKKRGLPKFISFDHDIEPDQYVGNVLEDIKNCKIIRSKNGYDCAKWLLQHCMEIGADLPDYQIHSMNPVGVENIRQLLKNYKKPHKL